MRSDSIAIHKRIKQSWQLAVAELSDLKVEVALIIEKVIANVSFFLGGGDIHSLVLIRYLQKGNIIMGKCYTTFLDKLDTRIKNKWPHLSKRRRLFLWFMISCTNTTVWSMLWISSIDTFLALVTSSPVWKNV